jgi:hypothetical protein
VVIDAAPRPLSIRTCGGPALHNISNHGERLVERFQLPVNLP